MKEPTMIFRGDEAEGAQAETIWGIPLFTKVVDATDVDAHVADGWKRHPFDVRDELAQTVAEAEQENDPALRSLEERAAAVGLKIDGRWSVAKLAEKVAEAEAGNGHDQA